MTRPIAEGFAPSSDLKSRLSTRLGEAFAAEDLAPELGRTTESDRPDLADFQCNGALAAAKAARANPREVASRILSRLEGEALLVRADIAGPGFLNLCLSDPGLSERANQLASDPRLGAPVVADARRVIIDYGGPNVAKPMHVGHLRTAVIGESLKRIMRYLGDTVIGDAHFGDWGFQMGLLISALADEQPDLPYFDETSTGPYPDQAPVSLEDLERLYPLASGRGKAEPEFRDKARKATAALQAGRPGYLALWRHFVEVSRTALIRDYGDLGVSFDWWKGESDADPFIAPMIAELRAKSLLVKDQGAEIIRVARKEDKAEIPPMLVISSEGSSMYGTTDLATIKQRREDFDFDLALYCVDARQSTHFIQVFRAAILGNYATEGQLEHAANGTVNGSDGKPFKTREGGVLKLGDLIAQARDKAVERLNEAGLGADLAPEAFTDTAHKVAIAALKFAELSNHRLTNYVFDLDRFMSFEGKTGPYLLYQAVRMKSILRKADAQGLKPGVITVTEPAERALVIRLDGFDGALRETYLKRAPNHLCDHVYRLAQEFSKFYAACPVLAGEDAGLKVSRLGLVAVTLHQLELGLELMGLSAPERM